MLQHIDFPTLLAFALSPHPLRCSLTRSGSTQTMCNVESSRSHGVFCVRVISAEPTPWGGEVTRDGRLSLVDLSGSENIKRSGAVGHRAKEAAAIGQVRPGYVLLLRPWLCRHTKH